MTGINTADRTDVCLAAQPYEDAGKLKRVEEDVRSFLTPILVVAALAACGGEDSQGQPPLQARSVTAIPSMATTVAGVAAAPTVIRAAAPAATAVQATAIATVIPTSVASPEFTVTPAPATAPASEVQGPQVVLPRDDSSHPTAVEWWYYNGHLLAEDGAAYGFHYVFFEVFGSTTKTYFHVGQLAVSDHNRGVFKFGQRFGVKGPDPQQGFRAVVEDWRMSGFDGEFDLAASLEGYALDLHLSAIKPAVAHGEGGVVDMRFAGDSHYYTYPRLRVSGTLTDGTEVKAVSGNAWMDHQWGDIQVSRVGWDWFSMQLDDNTELLYSIVRNLEDGASVGFGTYVDAAGDPHTILAQDVTVHSLDRWQSPASGISYPSGWTLEIGTLGLSLRLTPLLPDSEVHLPASGLPTYWEGEVMVEGERNGRPTAGVGFVELVGYSTP